MGTGEDAGAHFSWDYYAKQQDRAFSDVALAEASLSMLLPVSGGASLTQCFLASFLYGIEQTGERIDELLQTLGF